MKESTPQEQIDFLVNVGRVQKEKSDLVVAELKEKLDSALDLQIYLSDKLSAVKELLSLEYDLEYEEFIKKLTVKKWRKIMEKFDCDYDHDD